VPLAHPISMSRSAGTDAHSVLQLCSCFFLYEFVQRGIPPSRSTAAPKCITGPETRTSARRMACKGLAHGVSRQCMTHTRPLRVAAVQHRGAILSRDALCGFHTASSRLGARSRRFTAAAAQQDTPASAAGVGQAVTPATAAGQALADRVPHAQQLCYLCWTHAASQVALASTACASMYSV